MDSFARSFVKRYGSYTAPKIIVDTTPLQKIGADLQGRVKVAGELGSISIVRSSIKPYLEMYVSNIRDRSGSLRVIWFNRLAVNYLVGNTTYLFLGEIDAKNDEKTLVSPIFAPLHEVERLQKIYDFRRNKSRRIKE